MLLVHPTLALVFREAFNMAFGNLSKHHPRQQNHFKYFVTCSSYAKLR